VVDVVTRVIFGTAATVGVARAGSRVSRAINISLVERHNGSDRHRNARKARKTDRFSKDWWVHRAVTFFPGARQLVRDERKTVQDGEVVFRGGIHPWGVTRSARSIITRTMNPHRTSMEIHRA
jgi:hypothetical protein